MTQAGTPWLMSLSGFRRPVRRTVITNVMTTPVATRAPIYQLEREPRSSAPDAMTKDFTWVVRTHRMVSSTAHGSHAETMIWTWERAMTCPNQYGAKAYATP